MITNNKIKLCREKLEITQKELSKLFNLSEKTISGWENGYDDIPLEKLVIFCNKYCFNIDYVLDISKNTNQSFIYVLDKKIIGEKLKLYRNNLNFSQNNISKLLNISQSCYSQYETAKNMPTTTFLYSFCKEFNISMETFFIKS